MKYIITKIEESISSAAPETRLNTFKNFNSINFDREGGMEIFAPRVNTEINRMSDETYNIDVDQDDEEQDEGTDQLGNVEDDLSKGYTEEDTGLVINKKDRIRTPDRTLNYPYGMDNNPSPTFSLDNKTQSKSGIIFRYADYRGIGNFR